MSELDEHAVASEPPPRERARVRAWIAEGGIELAPGIGLARADARRWLAGVAEHSVHAAVPDPPYGPVEYEERDHARRREGRGGVWRMPPDFDGSTRSPIPRFTVPSADHLARLEPFFAEFAVALARVLVPGAHVLIAPSARSPGAPFRPSPAPGWNTAARSSAPCRRGAAATGPRAPIRNSRRSP